MDDTAFFQALSDLTDDASFDGAMERLYLISKIETGLKQAAAGELIEHQQAWEQVRTWLG